MSNLDFIGIGAQKSGTTWLASRLNELPDFSLPPIKEIHYFDKEKRYPSPNYLANNNILLKIFNRHWVSSFNKHFIKTFRHDKPGVKKWKMNYFFSHYSDQWYDSLFEDLEGKTGEITPAYSILEERDVKHMNFLYPRIKLIFLMRDPIERAWSHFRYAHPESKPNQVKEIKAFINEPEQELRSNYIRTLNNYRKFFSEDQLLIAFFDEIIEQPRDLLWKIVRFLKGDCSKIDKFCKLNKKENVSIKREMPEEIKKILAAKYLPLINELKSEFRTYPLSWYNKYYDN